MYFVYILYSESIDRYYVGLTDNLQFRLARHDDGKVRSTKHGRPWQLVYSESFLNRSDAMKREKEIKGKKSRKHIECFISRSTTGRVPT